MIGKRLLGVASAGVLVSCLGVLAACSGADEGKPSAAETFKSANVAITLHDASGSAVGEGAGILIAPRVVLTSAHLVAGKTKWTVRASDGTVAIGTKGLTKDWMVYDSMKAHPRLNDVAVIYLDKPIELKAYPKLATSHVTMGGEAVRVRKGDGAFATTTAKLTRLKSFPNAYVTDMSTSETLLTGGAVVNSNFEIVGLVTGRGMTTGKLYIARTDKLVSWLSPKVTCNAAGLKSGALSVRTYGAPPPKPDCEEDGGVGGSSGGTSSGGTTSGGTSSGGTDGTSGGTSSGGTDGSSGGASSGGPGDTKCDDGGGITYPPTGGDGSGDGSSSSGGVGNPSNPDGSGTSSSGGTDGSSGGTDGSSGGTTSGGVGGTDGTTSGGTTSGGTTSGGTTSGGVGGTDGTTSGGTTSGGTTSGGTDGTTSGGTSSGGTGGTDGTTSGGTSSGGAAGGSDGTTSGGTSSGGSASGSDDNVGDACTGAENNPEICPPEEAGCSGPNCGGGTPDDFIDYGKCACTTSPVAGGPVILR